MSFDLYFYKHKDNQLTEEGVAEYLTSNLQFNNSESSNQWVYENPETGVYFTIDWNKEFINIEETENFIDFKDLNFSFNINFFRPNYFGLEAFPIIDRLIEALYLYVLNPQNDEDSDNPIKFEKGDLLASWIRSNSRVTQSQHKEFNLEYMPEDKSNYFWWYQFHKIELENHISEDIYIPNLFIIKSIEDSQLYTACAWTTHIPLLLPVVDYVIIQKKYRKLFRTIEESGLIPYDTIIKELGNYFSEFQYAVPDLKILTQENSDKLEKKFNNLTIYKSVTEFGVGVGKDCFVNIPSI
jgi:hypothetical protein